MKGEIELYNISFLILKVELHFKWSLEIYLMFKHQTKELSISSLVLLSPRTFKKVAEKVYLQVTIGHLLLLVSTRIPYKGVFKSANTYIRTFIADFSLKTLFTVINRFYHQG